MNSSKTSVVFKASRKNVKIQSKVKPERLPIPAVIPVTPPAATSPMSHCVMGEKGIKQAVKRMRRMNKRKDPNMETVSPPAGAPLFLFQPVQGRQAPVNIFYDNGCSDCVLTRSKTEGYTSEQRTF